MHIDPIKDWLLIVRLVVSLGGPVIIFNALIDHHSFSSMVRLRISIQISRAIKLVPYLPFINNSSVYMQLTELLLHFSIALQFGFLEFGLLLFW